MALTSEISPNPVVDYLIIPSSLFGKNYIIYNLVGQQLRSGVFETNELEVTNLSKGVYVLTIEENKIPLKFVKK